VTAWPLAVLVGVLASHAVFAAVPEPSGYRLDHYRGAVPKTLHGAAVMHTAALVRFIAAHHPILIDVLPAPVPPPDARPGLPRMPVPHSDLPGSVWLPETGRGVLPPALETKFQARLAALTGHAKSAPMVFYCLSSCWMSWNAAKRAVGYGYTGVIWYPDGADGWHGSGGSLSVNTPAP
jgi:PQQ-dependent catabolism-associated CXXCW motif protein